MWVCSVLVFWKTNFFSDFQLDDFKKGNKNTNGYAFCCEWFKLCPEGSEPFYKQVTQDSMSIYIKTTVTRFRLGSSLPAEVSPFLLSSESLSESSSVFDDVKRNLVVVEGRGRNDTCIWFQNSTVFNKFAMRLFLRLNLINQKILELKKP